MKQIRHNVFETNSSSVHAITMCLKTDYDDWCDGKKFFYNSSWKLEQGHSPFFTFEEMLDFIEQTLGSSKNDRSELKRLYEEDNMDELTQILADYEFYTAGSYETYHEYEHYAETFEHPSGEAVVAFGYSGDNY